VGGGGQALLQVLVQVDATLAAALVVELAEVLAEEEVFLEELLAVGPRELCVGDRVLDEVSVLVGGLPGAAGELGLVGDVAVGAEEDSGGVADPGEYG
jgi:hypothetical protein